MDLVFIIASIAKMWPLYVTLQTVSVSFRESNASQFNIVSFSQNQFAHMSIRPQTNASWPVTHEPNHNYRLVKG